MSETAVDPQAQVGTASGQGTGDDEVNPALSQGATQSGIAADSNQEAMQSGGLNGGGERVPTDKWCNVCANFYDPETKFEYKGCSTCAPHDTPSIVYSSMSMCEVCLTTSLATEFETFGLQRLRCPLCAQTMSHEDAKRWATPHIFDKYDTLLARQCFQEDAKFIWCSNSACGSGQLQSRLCRDDPVVCHACGTKTCAQHPGQPWHEGLSCKEVDDPRKAIKSISRSKRKSLPLRMRLFPCFFGKAIALRPQLKNQVEVNEKLTSLKRELDRSVVQKSTKAEVVRTSKPCPGCGKRIQKNGGCNHMSCKSRNSNFTSRPFTSLVRQMWRIFLLPMRSVI